MGDGSVTEKDIMTDFANNYLISFGLCYNTFIRNYIPVGEFDKSVDFVITEDSVINCKADK